MRHSGIADASADSWCWAAVRGEDEEQGLCGLPYGPVEVPVRWTFFVWRPNVMLCLGSGLADADFIMLVLYTKNGIMDYTMAAHEITVIHQALKITAASVLCRHEF